MEDVGDKIYCLKNKKELVLLGKALSSDVRVELLELLNKEQLNVNEIAERLNIPASSAAMNVKVLEEAGIIETELRPGIRGSMKICKIGIKNFKIDLSSKQEMEEEVISMPIGSYVDYKVEPTCGIVSDIGYIDDEDEPRCFYNPERINAKLLWIGDGFIEYRFPNAKIDPKRLKSVEISAELSSEAPDFNNTYRSDITLWVNGVDAGTFYCPGDFGGRRGRLNPSWWEDTKSQYGMLKKWNIKMDGTYLDGDKVSHAGLNQYHLVEEPFISIRFGIKEDAKHKGGMNIFGDSFGDYAQNILMKIHY